MEKKRIAAIVIAIISVGLLGGCLLSNYLNQTCDDCSYDIVKGYPNISFRDPLGFYPLNDGSNRICVLEQQGTIKIFNNDPDVSSTSTFLDISSKVISGGEMGLLGLSFHPDYENNGFVYLNYMLDDPLRTRIARMTINDTDPNKLNASSEIIIMEFNQPYQNHNGGQLGFDQDGYLYVAIGDGGGAGDPDGNAQNKSSIFGKILRIDIDSSSPYSIPSSNPFYGNSENFREEIYAYGLRNPWRFSFDEITDRLWAADVGQNQWEEINIIESGKNYGWSILEGTHTYDGGDMSGLEPPVYEYSHQEGRSITGGYVYRGTTHADLIGNYIYADFITGKVWSLEYDGSSIANNTLLTDSDLLISSFGVDQSDELYLCAFDGYIYKLALVEP